MSMKMKNYGNEEYREPVILKKASIKCHDNEHEILRLEDFNLVVEKKDKVRPIEPCKIGIETEDGITYEEYNTNSCFLWFKTYYMKLPKNGRIIKFTIQIVTSGIGMNVERLNHLGVNIYLTQFPKRYKEIEDFDLNKAEDPSKLSYDKRKYLRDLGLRIFFRDYESPEDRVNNFIFYIDDKLKFSKDEYFNKIKNDNEEVVFV